MNRFLCAGLLLLLGETTLWAQSAPFRIYTQPPVPTGTSVGNLDLVLGWRTYLPMDGRHDGMYTVQVTQPDGRQLLVQARSGAIYALDAETGDIQWRAHLPTMYSTALPLGYNNNFVFAVTGANLSAFNRATGALEWEVMMPGGASAAPVADQERIYLTLGSGRMATYLIPKPPPVVAAKPAPPPIPAPNRPLIDPNKYLQQDEPLPTLGMDSADMRRLIFGDPFSRGGTMFGGRKVNFNKLWEYSAEPRLEMTPLLTPEFVLLGGYSGTMYALNKFDGRPLYRFRAGPPVTAQFGQYDLLAYIASQDFTVYALDILPGRTLWRFVGGGPIVAKPAVNDDDVFVTPEGIGLYRIGREHGDTIWRNARAERFVSANKRFVYSLDRHGRLLVLDKETGSELGAWEGARGFVFPIANEITDRLYLSSNDGLIVSLHDRHNIKPLVMKKPPAPPSAAVQKRIKEEEEIDFQ